MPPTVREIWPSLTVARRRALLAAVVVLVVLLLPVLLVQLTDRAGP